MSFRKPFIVQHSSPNIIIPSSPPAPPPQATSPSEPSGSAAQPIQFLNIPSTITLGEGAGGPLPTPSTKYIQIPSWIDLEVRPTQTPSNHTRSKKNINSRTETELTLLSRPLSPALSTYNDTNLNTRPAVYCRDVKVIVSLGDSLLTGLCMEDTESANGNFKSRLLSFIGYRKLLLPFLPWLLSGESRTKTCISGARIASVGRLLQHENSHIVGLSYRNTFMMSKGGVSDYNFAQSGATIDNLSGQVSRFLKKLKACHKQASNGWKLIVIWIGGNDCVLKDDLSHFEYELVSNIQRIRQSTTKSIVSLISLPDLSSIQVYGIKRPFHSAKEEKIKQRIAHNREIINHTLRNTVDQYDWGDGSDFRICLQPVPITPSSNSISKEGLISNYDHVHPNALAHQVFAKAIWLNLFRPDHEKLATLDQVLSTPWVTGGAVDEYIQC